VARLRPPMWLLVLLLGLALLVWIGVVVFGWPFAVA
jgi:hypothetical protein